MIIFEGYSEKTNYTSVYPLSSAMEEIEIFKFSGYINVLRKKIHSIVYDIQK